MSVRVRFPSRAQKKAVHTNCFFRARRAPLSYPPIIPHRGMEARDCPSRSADADLLKMGTSVTSFRFEPPKAVTFFIPTPPTSPAQGGKVTSSDNLTSEDLLFSCSISSCPACSGIFSRHTRYRSRVLYISDSGSEIRFFRRSLRSLPPPLSRLLAVNTHRVFTNRSRPRYLPRVVRPSEPNSP